MATLDHPQFSPQDRIVLCMKWGKLFPATYVNVLYRACRANISGPFRFVCLTDNPEGLVNGVEAAPIPDIGLRPDQWYTSGVWPKLALYMPRLHDLKGRALFIDLDMAIVGSLNDLFDLPGDYNCLGVGPGWAPGAPPDAMRTVGTGVFAFDIGSQAQIAETFMADRDAVISRFRNEQDFVASTARGIRYWPDDWVISFKRHLAGRYGLSLAVPVRRPPAATRIVAFHGDPRPADLLRRKVWGTFPHIGFGPVRWLREYWEEHSAVLKDEGTAPMQEVA
ncbi:MAG: hypothetical protein LCH69_03055 [Proteobacteria bacterium]|nr:hypothetical protein [Pseudomonadota bacterium]